MKITELERLRMTVAGPAACPSCGRIVARRYDLCPCCDEEVTVEPPDREFFTGPPFLDRDTACRLLKLIDKLLENARGGRP